MTVTTLQMSEWKQWVVSGSRDKCVYIWDIRANRLVQKFEAHQHHVAALQFEDNRLVSGSLDGTIKVGGGLQPSPSPPSLCFFSIPQLTLLLKIWDLRTFTESAQQILPREGVGITSLQFSDEYLVAGLADGTIYINYY